MDFQIFDTVALSPQPVVIELANNLEIQSPYKQYLGVRIFAAWLVAGEKCVCRDRRLRLQNDAVNRVAFHW